MFKQDRCVIISAYMQGKLQDFYTPEAGDFLLCADGGYRHAVEAALVPDLVIGDCDGGVDIPEALLLRVPVEKDDTDTMLCVKHAVEQGFVNLLILGGIGGRLDHTYSNIQSLAYAHARALPAEMQDAREHVFLLEEGEVTLPRREGASLSVFAYGGRCTGVYERGVKYPLTDATLETNFPLGVSNSITADEARISVRRGMLLIIQSKL